MKIVERLLGVEKRAQTFVLSTNVIEMRILFLTDDIVRICAALTGILAGGIVFACGDSGKTAWMRF